MNESRTSHYPRKKNYGFVDTRVLRHICIGSYYQRTAIIRPDLYHMRYLSLILYVLPTIVHCSYKPQIMSIPDYIANTFNAVHCIIFYTKLCDRVIIILQDKQDRNMTSSIQHFENT